MQRPTVNDFNDYESGNMSDEDTIVFMQKLIDTGMAWTLQGSYGRAAEALIRAGLCHTKEE